LAAVDLITSILDGLEQTDQEPTGDDSELIGRLGALLQEKSDARTEESELQEDPVTRSPDEILEEISAAVETGLEKSAALETAADTQDSIEDEIREQLNGKTEQAPEETAPAGAPPETQTSTKVSEGNGASGKVSVSHQTLRVSVDILDSLMNMVGELVLSRNQLLQLIQTDAESVFTNPIQHLNRVTSDVQEAVMKTRMQPIGNAWAKLPRLVRDLSQSQNKKIDLVMHGAETELDRQLLEIIQDPLTHIVRNSGDHGIEGPEARVRAGKPESGTINLNAYQESGHIILEIADDGAGIDVDKVRQKAVQQGLVKGEAAKDLPDAQVLQFLFAPGFSMAEKVTAVSGRGVGMDVVKNNIEKIGGTVDIRNKQGQGTTLRIKIPLTLAIIPALMVESGGDLYAIPQVNLLELVRLEGEQARKGIERVHGTPVYRLRGNLLPLVDLNRELMIEDETARAGTDGSSGAETISIVVLQADDRQFGMVVDAINDTEEIVVKPLGKLLKGIPLFASATIMGDGKVALILDVLGIAQRANVISEDRDRSKTETAAHAEVTSQETQTLLLIRAGQDGRMAIPLSQVARLEEFPRHTIERSGNQDVVQYRDEILPLIPISGFQPNASFGEADQGKSVKVVVYSDRGRSVGILVDQILDIVEETISVERSSNTPGMLGSAVIQGNVTDLIDVEGVIRGADPAFFDQAVPA
jgi:two-component system chemotaxis sensor kinase CheA